MQNLENTPKRRRSGSPDKQMNRKEREFIRTSLYQKSGGNTGLNGKNWSDKKLYEPVATLIHDFCTTTEAQISTSLLQRICYISASEPDIVLNEPSWIQTDLIYAYILGVPDASRSDAIRSHISLFCDWYPNDEEIARYRKLVELSGQLLFPSAEANAGIKRKLRYWQALAFVSLISVVSLVAWYKWQHPEPAVKACSAFPKMVSIPGGSFRMGNTFQTNESGAKSHEIDEYPAHTVNLDSFFLSETEITFDQYDCYTESNSLPYVFDAGAGRGYNPVIYVTWYDAVSYCNWLSTQQGLNPAYTIKSEKKYGPASVLLDTLSDGYRLPTEAEWEFAASWTPEGKSKFGNGRDTASTNEINYQDDELYSYRPKIKAVKSYNPNPLGLYDMSGNVYEWCWDWFLEGYYNDCRDGVDNPRGPLDGFHKIIRGGSWYFNQDFCRSSYREVEVPLNRDDITGFRVARSIKHR